LTQTHLAALAKVSRSTLSRFENNSGDVQLSSILRILSVLAMVDRKQEGTLLVRRHDNGTFSASFAPNLGAGGAMEAKVFPDLKALTEGLDEMHVPGETQSQVLRDLEQPGTVRIFDSPLVGLNRQAGYLFQADALFPWKTAIDNVAIGLEISGVPRAEALERAQAWLTSVGLGAFAERYPHMLSGGQRKRVGLAQVLIRDPKILLMDEPFGPLDAQTRQIMGNLLLELWSADRKAVLFVTHDLEEAIALADRVVIMSAGPNARIIGDWRVPLARPRDIFEVRLEKEFHVLHRVIWSVLKAEVLKSYAQHPDR